ncbi:hypothetical protein EV363DRAFT_1221139 [Boletus edulis]|nr:hypothetical protein EV363DRAFT_1221139 [Boletus edulis]
MSSELQSAVSSIVENNYVTLVILTAVGYDYILTFSEEIEYIWNKPWTRVSILFVLVRYLGLCAVILCVCVVSLNEVIKWLFTAVAMILRVWAIYSQSRIILGILLTLYVLEIVPFMIGSITTSIKLTMVTGQVLDFSFCVTDDGGFPILAEVTDILQFVLSATLCLLVAAQFIRQALQMYTVTKQWQLNRYMNLFAREGILYFLAVFLNVLINLLFFAAKVPLPGWGALPVGILENVPVFALTPRFILSLRALYAREGQGRDIDSEFGFTSVDVRSVGGIAFARADAGQSEEDVLEHDEDIQLVERETQSGVGSA